MSADAPPDAPALNRAQRRRLARYIAHEAALQIRRVRKKHPDASWTHNKHCNRCGLVFLGAPRCQCQPQARHECAMCHTGYMASQAERRFTNMCGECVVEFRKQREAEEARRDAAAEQYDAMREWDEEQQRLARDARDG